MLSKETREAISAVAKGVANTLALRQSELAINGRRLSPLCRGELEGRIAELKTILGILEMLSDNHVEIADV